MKGDFSRDTFNPKNGFYRVLAQQGRVQLDADWNEQTAIILHQIEAITVDMFGPHGGPERECGFGVFFDEAGDLCLSRGRYYVDGLLCDNREILKPGPPANTGADVYIVYLEVYERYLAAVQDPSLADVALDGLDTAGRSQICWQVKYWPLETPAEAREHATHEHWMRRWDQALREIIGAGGRGRLRARASSAFGYTGAQNQLYRVEVHQRSDAGDGSATWKWSRENGSVACAVIGVSGNVLDVQTTARSADAFVAGDWVEITTDADREDEVPKPALYQIAAVPKHGEIQLTSKPARTFDSGAHWIVRRWDQRRSADRTDLTSSGGLLALVEDTWLPLESGIEVHFASPPADDPAHCYRGGDYWLIPARTATGAIEWRGGDGHGEPPFGVRRRYAPLGGIVRRSGELCHEHEFRLRRKPLSVVT